MKRISLDLSEILLRQMDEAVLNEGFQSRSEFLRFLIMTHTKRSETKTKDPANEEREQELHYGHPEEDFEYGIPKDVVDRILEEVRAKKSEDENRPQLQS